MSVLCIPVFAKVYKVCTVEIPGGMTADKKGPQPLFEFYQQVTNIVTKRTGHRFDLMFAPASRCIESFNQNKIDFMWPFIIADDAERIKKLGLSHLPLYSMPMIMGGFYIFTRQSDPIINHVEALEGKIVVNARGYGIPEAMEKNDKIIKVEVNSNEQVPQMLMAKRVDAAIIQTGWVPALEKLGLLKGIHHGSVIEFWGGSFTFNATEEGTELMNMFSQVILQLVVEGKYEELMKDAPYAIPAYRRPK